MRMSIYGITSLTESQRCEEDLSIAPLLQRIRTPLGQRHRSQHRLRRVLSPRCASLGWRRRSTPPLPSGRA